MGRKAFIVIIGFIFIIGVGVFWWIKSQSFMTESAAILSSEITKTINTKIDIASVQIKSPTKIAVDDITLYTKNGDVLASAKNVDIAFSPFDMIRGKSIVQTIDSVTVDTAFLSLIQDEDGKWNYEELLSGERSSHDFKGKVELKNSVVKLSADQKTLRLENVNGSLDFVSQPSIAMAISVEHNGANLDVSGTLGGERQAVSLKGKDINLENYLEFLPDNMAIQVQKGNLKQLDMTVLKVNDAYEFTGETVILGGSVDVEGTVIDQIDGLLLFNEKEVRVFSRGKIAEQPIVLRGTTNLDVVKPLVNLQLSSKGFDASKVLNEFPLKGPIAFQANIHGEFDNPVISGAFDVADGTVYDYKIHDVKTKLKFANHILFVEQATGSAFGGTFNLQGQVDTDTQAYNLQAKVKQIALHDLKQYIPEMTGQGEADVVISGKGTTIDDNLVVYGNLGITDGSYQGIGFKQLDTSFYKQGDRIAIDYANVALNEGKISAEGAVNGQNLDLAFYGSGVGLQQVSDLYPEILLNGVADFTGKISGTLASPAVQANFSASNGNAFYQPFEVAKGNITVNENQLYMHHVDLLDGVSKHEINGSIGLTGSHGLNLTVLSRQARMENIAKLLFPNEDITGNVDNDVTITGTLDDINAEGELRFHEGSFRKILLTSATGRYVRKNGQTELKNFVISAPSLNVKLSGILKANEDLDFQIVADDIQLDKLRLQLPYPVQGKAKFVGSLQGNVNEPIFNGHLTADAVTFNGQELNAIDGKINFDHHVLKLNSLNFKQGESKFSLSGNIDTATNRIKGDLDVMQGNLASILKILNVDQNWIDGMLNGNIHVEGTTDSPKVRLLGNLKNGSLKKYALDSVDLDIFLDDQLVTITRFDAVQGNGRLVAQGKMNLGGALDVEIAGQNIEAGLLTNLADYDVDTKGLLNFGAQITGTVENPNANISVDVQGGGVNTATFDSLYGMFILQNGIINVQQILVNKGSYKASAYGIIPLAAIMKDKGQYADVKEQMDLKVSLDQADLSILPLLSKQIEWAIGPTKGNITLNGTIAEPLINGSITVTDGAVKFKDLAKPVQKMALDIQFLNDKIDLKTFEGVMGNGSYKMFGTSQITGDGLKDYNFELKLDKLEIANKYYTGPLEGTLTLTENKGVPKVVGNLNFENCTLDIPAIPEGEDQLPHVRLDIDVTAGKKVRLYNSFLYDIWFEGHANFSGSTLHPRTSGEFQAKRGTISYLKTPFKVREATAYFNQVGSFLPTLSVNADTRLESTKVYLNIDGPADAMNIRLNSSPAMNEQELLTLLTLRSRYNSKNNDDSFGRDELTSMLNIGLQMSFLNELENMVRKAIGVDEFNIVRDTLSRQSVNNTTMDREVYNVEIGKYLNDKTILQYTAGVDHDAYKFGVRYEFDHRFSLTSDIDQDRNTAIGLEARIKF